MTRDIIVLQHGAVTLRAALVRNGTPLRFWFGAAPGDEAADQRPLAGRTFFGRVTSVDRSLNAAFVDIGAQTAGFLPLRPAYAGDVKDGAMARFTVATPPRRAKGAVLAWAGPAEVKAVVGRADATTSPREALRALDADDPHIVTDSASVKRALSDADTTVEIVERAHMDAFDIDACLDGAFSVSVSGPGVTLHIHESEAVVAIDVDTGQSTASSSARLREKAIATGAEMAALQIERRNLAGRIVIDFPSIRDKTVRDRAIETAMGRLGAVSQVTARHVMRSNFTSLVRQRRGPSLLDSWTESVAVDPVGGRQFTLDWQLQRTVAAAEQRQAQRPGARLTLRAGAALAACCAQRGLVDRYLERWGAPLMLREDNTLEPRDFVIDEH